MSPRTALRLAARRIAIDGAALGASFALLVIVSLRLDARVWLDDYPPDVRAAVGDMAGAPTGLKVAAGVALFAVVLTGVIYSNHRLWIDSGKRSGFGTAFVHTLALFWVVNAFDVVVVDWLFFVTLQPDFVVLPGTAGLAGYRDYGYHLRESVFHWGPWLGTVAGAAVVAGAVSAVRRLTGRARTAAPTG